ncbi:MAG: glycosyltransferase family 9 protein [Alphaproteobacteria bacterium]
MRRILVILGESMGRFVQATGALRDIREFHKDSHITLLTTRNLLLLAGHTPWVDEVIVDKRRPWWHVKDTLHMWRFLRHFHRVYDLQHDVRSQRLCLLGQRAVWSSMVDDCGYPITAEVLKDFPTVDALRLQLAEAGVPTKHKPDLTFAATPGEGALFECGLKPNKFIALIPGSRLAEKAKRWPHYLALGKELQAHGWPVAIIGSLDEEHLVRQLAHNLSAPLLFGLPLPELIGILQHARLAIGNDTGPLHIATACGVESILLLGKNTQKFDSRASHLNVLYNAEDIAAISPQKVHQTVKDSVGS